jgi:alpha-galactosidase
MGTRRRRHRHPHVHQSFGVEMTWTVLAEIPVDPRQARVFEHGWQSWSPTTWYRLDERPHRPATDRNRLICYRPEVVAPADAFWGEGLLAICESPAGPTHIFAAPAPDAPQASIRADARHYPDRTVLVVSASQPVTSATHDSPGEAALSAWANQFFAADVAPAPTLWSHWYHYYGDATSADILENLAAIEDFSLAVDVVTVDDAYQTAIGDWLSLSDSFRDLEATLGRIRDRGYRSGIWMAPFLAGEHSQLAERHPDWLVRDESGVPLRVCHNWNQHMYAIDTTHPDAIAWLTDTVGVFRSWGVDFFKMDFVFAAAVEGVRKDSVSGVAAYRQGLQVLRQAMGDSYLMACGAPILPSVGLVDAMRVSPDTDPKYSPPAGDMSQPSQEAAVLTGRGRAFTHGRWWANDADCLMARPGVERREEWAEHVRRFSGLRGSGDRLRSLDTWGLETTRALLQTPSPKHLV